MAHGTSTVTVYRKGQSELRFDTPNEIRTCVGQSGRIQTRFIIALRPQRIIDKERWHITARFEGKVFKSN